MTHVALCGYGRSKIQNMAVVMWAGEALKDKKANAVVRTKAKNKPPYERYMYVCAIMQ